MFSRAVMALLITLGVGSAFILSTEPAAAAGVVGTGSPASCTDAALTTALIGGGIVTFNCGGGLVIMPNITQHTITVNTTINSNDLITLDANNANRHFIVNPGVTLTLQHIFLRRGNAGAGFGGSIYNDGTLILTDSGIANSTAGSSGGAIFTNGPLTITDGYLSNNNASNGGAINVSPPGHATITNTVMLSNNATGPAPSGFGGALRLTTGTIATIQGGDILNNTAAYGAAVYVNASSLTLQGGTRVQNNHATEHGGGIYVFNSAATLSGITLSGNSAAATDGHGGGIYNDASEASLSNVTLSDNAAFRGGGIYNTDSTVVLTNTMLSDNSASSAGGGLWSFGVATLTDVTLSGNSAATSGGGIFNSGTATLTAVTLSGNTTLNGGGGISNTGTANLTGVTLSGNSAAIGSPFSGYGGGIYNAGTVTLENITLSGNSSSSIGGGIANYSGATLTHVTMSGNSAPSGGGIWHYTTGAAMTLHRTLIANSVAGGNCFVGQLPSGPITSTGFNLSDDDTCTPHLNHVSNSDQNNAPDGLGPLANNGGTTQTHLPQTGSAAIDKGACAPSSDQRGLPRPVGLCDVGAVEVQLNEMPTPTPTATATPSPTTTPTRTPTPTITLSPSATLVGAPTATSTLSPTPTLSPTTTPSPSTTLSPTATSALSTPTTTPTAPTPTATPPPDTLNRISVYLQSSTGAFQGDLRASAASTLPLPPGGLQAIDIALGDVSGDGVPDIVAIGTNNLGANVRVVYPSGPAGTFGAPTVIPSSGTPLALAVADVNQNGRLDLAVATGNSAFGQIEYYLDGATLSTQTYFSAGQAVALALGRVTNNDDLPDFVVATSGNSAVQITRQSPTDPFLQDPCFVGGVPRKVVLGRSNLASAGLVDNDLDLFVALPTGVFVLENGIAPGPPPLGFCPPGTPSQTIGAGLDVVDLALADLNGDGRLDVLALTVNPPAVTSFLAGASPGIYGAGVTSTLAIAPVALAVLLPTSPGATANLVVAHAPGGGQGNLSILGGSTTGSFTLLQTRAMLCGPSPRLRLAVADLNADGRGDFAVSGCSPVAEPPTPTPTATASPSLTAVAATLTLTPIVTPTRTPSPTATVATLGGRGFSLETNPGGPAIARWSPGTLQTGYQGLRIALPTSTFTFFPGGTAVFPPDFTSFLDFAPGDIGCYLTLVLGGNPPGTILHGNSDAICLFRGVASGATPPNFKAQLNESLTATLTWTAPGNQSGYNLVVIPTDGSDILFLPLGAGVTSTTHTFGEVVTCYQLQVSGLAGQTDALCAFPHGSTLSPAAAQTTSDRLRASLNRSPH